MALTLDFAFEGFRIIRERPMLILFWAPVLLLSQVMSTVILILMAGPEFMAMMEMQRNNGATDPDAVMSMLSLMQKVTPATAAAFIVSMLFSAIVLCAVYRAVLGGTGDRAGFLKFGKDELRQIVVSVLLLCFVVLLAIVSTIALLILGSVLIGGLSVPNTVVASVTGVVSVAFYIWLLVRLSLIPVQSFDQGRINFTGSFKLTKGHFWQLLSGYTVAIIMIFLVITLCEIIFAAVAVSALGGDMGSLNVVYQRDFSKLENLNNPAIIGYMLMSALRAPLLSAIMIGAQAAAYKLLKNNHATI
ncbi:hypothetical protein [Asticcacaulis machinosus]|uniref:Glycerophosphoryl diester phosphodiesterase membrane domain-containing protein n=1 Tax=Asticcacaulis machinosus TaxID=2984211 RepID=A0ABT5HFV6_9CAUL|nr:hypothetical protein [Asticcacaulis machinosus]MDC7675010.1 hypothetical protein [Asticcacaulis machinosus]